MTISAGETEKIGLFGGTFDPVHLGHTIIAEWVLTELGLNKIIFIPNKLHPFAKRKNIIPAQMRLEMLKIALKDFSYFGISSIEIEREGISYTVDTIRAMISEFGGAEIYYMMGQDNLAMFHKWKDAEKILDLAKVVTFRRRTTQSGEITNLQERITILQNPYFDISSSEIRRRIREKQPFQSLLHPGVYRFILENNLYKS